MMRSTAPPPDENKAGAPRILVVDDSATFRRAIGEILERAGYVVEAADTGERAFELCHTGRFDLVVTDITMGALSGVQLCRLIRSDPATARVPVVLLSAADDRRSRFWGRNAGAQAHVSKDRMRDALVPELERVLAAQTPPPAGPAIRRHKPPRALERLSLLLDDLLYQAVLASEARRLMDHTSDRSDFARAVLAQAGEVADYAYLVLRLEGEGGATHALHARGPWPDPTSAAALAALGLSDVAPTDVEVVHDHGTPAIPPATRVESGEMAWFPINAGRERLGELLVFGGRERLAAKDRMTLEVLTREIGPIAKLLSLMEDTRRLALTDGLTGLHNRRRCVERLELEIARAARFSTPLSIALCDVDHFKQVNDVHGHNAGDSVLREIARALERTVRRVDLAARWGGEEFLIVLPGSADEGARIVAERLRAAVEQMPRVADGPERVTASVGVSSFVRGDTVETLVERADRALYRAKERGRNRVETGD